jgi:hypothetical protein
MSLTDPRLLKYFEVAKTISKLEGNALVSSASSKQPGERSGALHTGSNQPKQFSSALFKRLEEQRALTSGGSARATGGGEENSNNVASQLIGALNQLQMDFGAGSDLVVSDLSDVELSLCMFLLLSLMLSFC